MFKSSKYTKWYFQIIERARNRPKFKPAERHHVIPKCIGGADIVLLTPREHYVCHALLTKMTTGELQSKMFWAMHRMIHSQSASQQRYFPPSSVYEHFRLAFREKVLGKPKSKQHAKKLATHLRKMNTDPEMIERRRQSMLGQKRSTEQRKNISTATARAMSDPKVIAKMKRSSKNRWADPAERQKIADKNSRTFQLTRRETGEVIIIKNLAQYCRENSTHHRKVHQEFYVERLK